MSTARVFFAGVGTTILLIGAGFGGGLMLANMAMEPVPQNAATPMDRLPAARVILPASAEAAMPASSSREEGAVATSSRDAQQHYPSQLPPSEETQAQPQPSETESQAERAERKMVQAEERARRKRHAERKARREAARAKQREQQQLLRQQPGIMAFGRGDEQSIAGGFFGN
jgi:hypothetical protein